MSLSGNKRSNSDGDLIDLTAEDDNTIDLVSEEPTADIDLTESRRKKRKSEKRQRQLKEFRQYLATRPPEEQSTITEGYFQITEEKREAMKERERFLRYPVGKEEDAALMKSRLDQTLLVLEGMEDSIRNQHLPGDEVQRIAAQAQRIGHGLRRQLNSFNSDAAISRMAGNVHRSEFNMLRNDPIFDEARRNSMVTLNSVSTNSRYRPIYSSETANRDLIRNALEDPVSPGLLPDGSYIPYDTVQRYRRSARGGVGASSGQDPSHDNLIEPQTALPLSSVISEYQDTEYLNSVSQGDIRNFENLVDLALNEAEPLDFPPQMLCATLEHQRQGLGWLIRAEHGRNKGGILADDMGLGKTVQTIALFYANPPPALPLTPPGNPSVENHMTHDHRLVLIVCPVALIATWEEELRVRVKPDHQLRVYVHHSVNKRRLSTAREIQNTADVVICSYHGLATEYKQIQKFRKHKARLESSGDYAGAARLSRNNSKTPMFDIIWHRVVLDEAHIIKNKSSQISQATTELNSKYRLALTGTPMQNRLEELYPLVRFLHLEPHQNWTAFKKLLPPKGSGTYARYESQKALAAFLSATLLRRKKDTVINNRKIIEHLPPKHLTREEVFMEGSELATYTALEAKIKGEFKRQGQRLSSRLSTLENMTWSNMLVYLLRLRQTACHPLLSTITKSSQQRTSWGNNEETRAAIAVAMLVNSRFRENAVSISDEDRVCFNCDGPAAPMIDAHVMVGCGHIVCSECSPSLMDHGEGGTCTCGIFSRDLANLEILHVIEETQPGDATSCLDMLLSYQSPRVAEQKQFEDERKRCLERLRSEAQQKVLENSWMSPELDLSASPEISAFEDTSVESDSVPVVSPKVLSEPGSGISDAEKLFIENESQDEQSENIDQIDKFGTSKSIRADDKTESPTTESTDPETATQLCQQEPTDPLDFKIDINKIAKLFKVANIFTNGWISSAKVESCLETLRGIWRDSPNDKVIIFTSFTCLIDVLTIPLEAAMISYEEYTGRMGVQERNDVLDRFKTGRCRVLLTSLKAGNVGLTLTQANRVIIMEPFWNPYIEEQAQDRVYRIGQSREVTIYRLLVNGTVEDRIVELQERKRSLIECALDNSAKTKSQNLSRADIMFALGLQR